MSKLFELFSDEWGLLKVPKVNSLTSQVVTLKNNRVTY